ncbi:MAG: sialidase family protein [Myxococcota bacterium]
MACGIALFAAGCNPDGGVPDFTLDVRIDGAGESNDPDSFGTEMCVTDDGTVYVIWMDDRDDRENNTRDIWMNRSPDLGDPESWLPVPVKVNAGDPEVDSNVWNPDLFCNELGVFVVWEDDRDGVLQNHQIYFNRSTDQGETFMPEDIVLENDPDGMSMSLEPKITGYGQDLFVTWYDSLNGAYDILLSSSSEAGSQWRAPARVDSDDPAGSAYSARPEIAISENGEDVWIAWEDSRDGAADIYFARSDNGGTTFKEDERLDGGATDDNGAHDSFEPVICNDGSEYLYVVWHDSANSDLNRDIYYNYSSDKGDGWSAAAQRLEVDSPGFGNSLFPQCVADGDTAHIAWYDQQVEEAGYDIFYRKLAAGLPSSEPVRLDVGEDSNEPAGYANSTEPVVAMDGGTVAVAWSDFRGEAQAQEPAGYDDIYYNYSENGGPFREFESGDGDLRVDSWYTGTSFKVELNFDVLGGTWFAAWTDGREGTSDIYFHSMAVGERAIPPKIEDIPAE